MKICFIGAGSTVFAKNVLGDCILTPELGEFEIALFDIDRKRLEESYRVITAINTKYNGKAVIKAYLDRRSALWKSDFIVNAIQVGGYKPCTVTDFDIPKKYGLKQTIGDTLGIGGIMRALRTINVLEGIAADIEELCPNAYFLNYTNPMAMLTGYLLTYTKVKSVGLCHSVQSCVPDLLRKLKIDVNPEDVDWEIFGINHQAWLLKIVNKKTGEDMYPLIKEKSQKPKTHSAKHDLVRFELMNTFGYYVTESSEHNAEYTPWFIKKHNSSLIRKYNIPLDEYPRRCRRQIAQWNRRSKMLERGGMLNHTKSKEYGSRIITALYTGVPYAFHGSTLNTNLLIPNLPAEACVEVPIIADKNGLTPKACYALPEQCAAINLTNINPQLLTLKANKTRLLDDIIRAAALDPHTAAVLSLGDIKKMCLELYEAHYKGGWLPKYN